MMAVVPTSLMQRYENYPLVDKLYSIKHFKLSWDPFGCPKFEGYTFLYDDYAIDVSETTRFTLLEENNFPFYPLVHTIETLVRIPRRRLLIGFNCVFELLLQDHSKEKRKEVNQRYHAKKIDKQQIDTEPLQNIDHQPRQRTIRNTNNASTSRGIRPIDKENISPHSSGNVSHVQNDFSKYCNKMTERNKQRGKNKILFTTGETIEEQNDARDYEVGNNEEASITGEHHFTHDEENTEICSAITYETQNDVRDDTEVHLNPINEDDPYDFVYDHNDLTNKKSGVYTFRAHGGIYHRIDQLVPRDGKPSLRDLGPLDNYRVTLNASVELDQRVYNRPTTAEVTGIWVEGNENITTYKRSIVVYGRSDYSTQIQPYEGCYDPLSYPLFFPNDMYIKIETSRLLYYRLNQKKIRSELYQGIVDYVNASEVEPSKVGQRVVLPASFIGGLCDMRRRFLDAMTLVQDDGKPDIFLTITCNPGWPEITDYLEPGQDAQDRPDLVSRVFRAKLEDIKDQLLIRHILGKVREYVYVLEFQKRGLPHAHFLLIMRAEDKLKNPEQYDQKVCAEIPDPIKYPKMHEIVVKHMMHGPCGSLGPSSPCMQGEQKKCRWRYPRQFNEVTMQGNDSYPLYRRRDSGVVKKVRDKILDNRWVVPYNPKLLMMLNCHLNVEVCSSIKSVKYAFKYVYKGHDKQVVHIDPDEPQSKIDEIKRYQNARYVSPPEAIWRIFSFALSQIYPSVIALHLHLPNQQLVRFSDNDIITDIVDRERDKSSMLTDFFKINKVDGVARKYLYKDFPTYFTWNSSKHCWNQRKKGAMRGRIVSANPAEGERYYLRFPAALRRLFATILIYCEPGDVRKLWDEHYNSLSEDYSRQCQSYERVKTMVLVDIGVFLQYMGKHLGEFDLPLLNTTINLESGGYREVQEEYSIVVEDEHVRAKDSLNSDQKVAYDEIMRHVDCNLSGVFFIDGPGGTGKTFLYKALLAEVRSCGLIALATASSGAAANNMPGERTTHSRFKIPINLDNNSMCNIKQQSGVAQLLRLAKIIIWDDPSMAHRQAVEAVDRSIQDITKLNLPFGGKIMILGGEFRQVLPVVRRGTRAQIVDSSLRMSPLWPSIKKLSLTINMRALADPWFSEFLMRVGDGEEGAIDGTFIRIPDDMSIAYTDKAEDDKNNFYPMEFLNSLNFSGLPPHYLRLKIGCPIILLRNIYPSNGLCNGTRLICKGFQMNVIDAEIAVGHHAGKRVFLARIPLCPSADDMFPFKLKRKQFPIRLSFAMTINKAQCQTIPNVGVYLPESVFSHGQLYVALSRGISRENTKVLVKPVKEFTNEEVYTSNVVYREVLHDI
ncbi:hypothetical protein LXL04_003911 [Taraxacum kok-saghyz]